MWISPVGVERKKCSEHTPNRKKHEDIRRGLPSHFGIVQAVRIVINCPISCSFFLFLQTIMKLFPMDPERTTTTTHRHTTNPRSNHVGENLCDLSGLFIIYLQHWKIDDTERVISQQQGTQDSAWTGLTHHAQTQTEASFLHIFRVRVRKKKEKRAKERRNDGE